MYATVHQFRRWPDEESQEWARTMLASLLSDATPMGACVLGRLEGLDGAVVLLWDGAADASAAAARTAGTPWLGACAYRVVQVDPGRAAGESPRFAQLAWLNGGGDGARADAAVRAGRERIAPAVRAVEGVVCTYVLRAEDDTMAVLTLVTDVDTPDRLQGAVLSTRLLPWEDPAQVTGLDRLDVARVLVADLPAPVPAGVRS